MLLGSRCSMCSNGADVSAPREPLLHMLQHSCSLCSKEATTQCAPVEHLYLLLESSCSTCSSRAARCAPGKLLLHNTPLEHLYLLQGSHCSIWCSVCSSGTALCVPRKQLLHNPHLDSLCFLLYRDPFCHPQYGRPIYVHAKPWPRPV